MTLSAIALGVATLVFPADRRIALDVRRGTSGRAAPRQPTSRYARSAIAVLDAADAGCVGTARPTSTWDAAGRRDGPDRCGDVAWAARPSAGWVAAIGTTEMRELRGRIPWYGITRQSRRGRTAGDRWRCRLRCASCALSATGQSGHSPSSFVATMVGAASSSA